MQPNVNLPILDGGLGILPPSQGDILAVVGAVPSGPIATPATFARVSDLQARHTSGPLVEAAALDVVLTGKPVVVVGTGASTAAVIGAVTKTGTGTFDPIVDTATVPDDDYDAYIAFVAGTTAIGTAGATYQTSLDNGITLSAVAALGTATSITIPTPSGLVKLNLEPSESDIVALSNELRTKFLAHIIFADLAAKMTGTVDLSGITLSTLNGQTFLVTSNVGGPDSVTFTTPSSIADIAVQINAVTTGDSTASIVGNHLVMTGGGTSLGTTSTLLLGSGTANATLGFTNGQTATGTNEPHKHADTTSDDGVTAASTDLATAILLLNSIKAGYAAHRVLAGAGPSQIHLAADSTNIVTAADATDGFTARTLATDLKAKLNAHEALMSSHTIADVVNVVADTVGAGTIDAGDVVTFRLTAAKWNTTELGAALTALKNTGQTWDVALIVGAADTAALEAVDTWLAGMAAKNKFKRAVMATRIPNVGEDEATYLAAMTSQWSAEASKWINLCSGSAKTTSGISSRSYKRPTSWRTACHEITVDPGQDLAAVALGPLSSVKIVDANGNPEDHDETVFPGLDDQRFTVFRSFEGRPGVFVNNGRIFAPVGSDFIFVQYRRIMNLGARALVSYLENRLSAEVGINPQTGFIAESSAAEIEAGGTKAMADVLLPFKRASNVSFVLSRTDNILSTFTLTGEARIVPNGYVKFFSVPIGFNNPALRTFAAAA
jgi:hypothetical protein